MKGKTLTPNTDIRFNPDKKFLIFHHKDKEEWKEHGRLFFDDNGKLSFTGDVNKSADSLFRYVCERFNKEFQEK